MKIIIKIEFGKGKLPNRIGIVEGPPVTHLGSKRQIGVLKKYTIKKWHQKKIVEDGTRKEYINMLRWRRKCESEWSLITLPPTPCLLFFGIPSFRTSVYCATFGQWHITCDILDHIFIDMRSLFVFVVLSHQLFRCLGVRLLIIKLIIKLLN